MSRRCGPPTWRPGAGGSPEETGSEAAPRPEGDRRRPEACGAGAGELRGAWRGRAGKGIGVATLCSGGCRGLCGGSCGGVRPLGLGDLVGRPSSHPIAKGVHTLPSPAVSDDPFFSFSGGPRGRTRGKWGGESFESGAPPGVQEGRGGQVDNPDHFPGSRSEAIAMGLAYTGRGQRAFDEIVKGAK